MNTGISNIKTSFAILFVLSIFSSEAPYDLEKADHHVLYSVK